MANFNPNTFEWDMGSAFRKGTSNITVSWNPSGKVGPIEWTGQKAEWNVTGPFDPEKEAFRGCLKCHQHWNKHHWDSHGHRVCPGH